MSDVGFLNRLQDLVRQTKLAEPSEPISSPFHTRDTEPHRLWAAWFFATQLKPHLELFAHEGEEKAKVLIFDPEDPVCLDTASVKRLPYGGYETFQLCLIGKAGALIEYVSAVGLPLTLEQQTGKANIFHMGETERWMRMLEHEKIYREKLLDELGSRNTSVSRGVMIIHARWEPR